MGTLDTGLHLSLSQLCITPTNLAKILSKSTLFQILLSRLESNPEDPKTLQQIEQVKIYLISFSEQQKEVLDKVRLFLADLEEEKNKTPEKEPISKVPACPTPKSKKNKPKSKPKSSKNSSEAASDSSDEENNELFLSCFSNENCYKGHVEEYDIGPDKSNSEENLVEEFSREGETVDTLENIDKEIFFDRIDLITPPVYDSTVSHIQELRRRKQILVVSYIPDLSDRKRGYQTFNFLQNTVTSPPHLRQRKPNQLPSLPPRSSPRTLPPIEKMETRNKTLNLFKTQVDGCNDDLEDESEVVQQKIQLRDSLLKRKLEDEMIHWEKRARIAEDKRERNKDERMLLLKEQKDTEQKIFSLLQHIADVAASSSDRNSDDL